MFLMSYIFRPNDEEKMIFCCKDVNFSRSIEKSINGATVIFIFKFNNTKKRAMHASVGISFFAKISLLSC